MPILKVGAFASALDLPEFERGGATEALNVIPRSDSYGPLPSFSTQGDAMAERVQGACIARGVGGQIAQFAGTATKLYRWDANGLAWTDVSSAAYATPSDGHWSFCQFGDFVIADNGFDVPQVFAIGSSSVFADLAGSPPVFRSMATVRDFVFGGAEAGFSNRVRWSGFNDHTQWTQSQTTQSDLQDLPDGGKVMSIIGGEYAIIIQERNIQRATYANLPLIWQFDKIAQGIGTPYENATTRYEDLIFFISADGFQMLSGGQQLTPIGKNVADKFFLNDVNSSFLDRVTNAVDPINKLVVWSYPSTASADGTPDKGLIYNWPDNKWARLEQPLEIIHSAVSQAGFTLDQLDVFGSLDSLSRSLDSAFWVGAGRPSLAGFSVDHKIGFFNGQFMAATVDTTELQPSPGYRSQINYLRPMIEGDPLPTIQIGHRSRLTDAVAWESAVAMNDFGVCPVLVNDRHHARRH